MMTTISFPDLYEASIADLQDGLGKAHFTSVDLVKAYLARIEEVNFKGPELRAVIETNPSALKQAKDLDSERKTSGARGPLHGIPILIKDNIATEHSEGMNTTAGSYALLGSVVPRDATVAAKLRAAGAIILGKTTPSEWANFRGSVPSGFCGRTGQSTSPYVPLGNPSGSSSGSAIAMAIGLAAGSLGTETNGSIVSPSNNCNLVGMKPTVGLTSRAGVIPISSHQDSIGPMCRSVADAAVVLAAIAGRDPLDEYTLAQPAVVPDYIQALKPDGLKGVRLGVPRNVFAQGDETIAAAFNATLSIIRRLGATVIDPADMPGWHTGTEDYEDVVLRGDFKVDITKYISGLVEVPTGVKDLADLIHFNTQHAEKELVKPYWTDQSTFIKAQATSQDQAFHNAVATDYKLGRGAIDGALKAHNLDALIMPTEYASTPPAIAAYPIITVPLGFLPPATVPDEARPTRGRGPNMPFGISFFGTAYTEFQLLQYAYAYEQATHTRLKQKAYPKAIPKTQLVDVVGK
ncbi:amidase signature enzyme [Amylocystis lapponica]|nr:amidase signature enzyme [Amylocystis lapponica]